MHESIFPPLSHPFYFPFDIWAIHKFYNKVLLVKNLYIFELLAPRHLEQDQS